MKRLLDTPVLVLNRLWQPVNTCSARRAVSLLFVGHAQVVQSGDENNFYTHDVESWIDYSETSRALGSSTDDFLHSVKLILKLPRIIVLSEYDRLPKKEVKFTRQNIFQRDKFTCQYCGVVFDTKKLNLDHVVPRDKGGKSSWDNLVTSCIVCNTRKSNKMPAEARMFPLRTPAAPRWRPFSTSVQNQECHESWRHFLDLSASQVEMSA
ncbi:MAG: HNH endonuclease [Verrucomicrobiae bacterium]|nr:HNH endonuclease [Verrucomicrobiae bacterium]